MTYRRVTTFTATEKAALPTAQARYEYPEMYNRVIGYVPPWTDEERQSIERGVHKVFADDPISAMEILDMLGLE